MLLPNILHVSKTVAEGQHLSACVVISLCGYQPVWLGKHRRRAVETKQTRAHNKTCTSEVRSWLKRACYSPCGWKSSANHLHKHEQILRSLQNMPSSVESIKGGKTEQDSLCCSLSLLLGLLDGSYSSSRDILSGNLGYVHKHLVSTGHLGSDIAADSPAFELMCQCDCVKGGTSEQGRYFATAEANCCILQSPKTLMLTAERH